MKKSRYNYLVDWKENQTLLFNTWNHGLVELDDDTLRKYNDDTLDVDIAGTMSELGFLIEDNVNELKEIQQKYEKSCANPSHMNGSY